MYCSYIFALSVKIKERYFFQIRLLVVLKKMQKGVNSNIWFEFDNGTMGLILKSELKINVQFFMNWIIFRLGPSASFLMLFGTSLT